MAHFLSSLALAGAILVCLPGAAQAQAQPQARPSQKDLTSAEKAKQQAASRLQDSRSASAQAEQAQVETEIAIMDLGEARTELETQLAATEAQLAELDQRLRVLAARMESNREGVREALAGVMVAQRQPRSFDLLRPDAANDAILASLLMGAIAPQFDARARRAAAQALDLSAVREAANRAQAIRANDLGRLEILRSRLDGLLAERRVQRARSVSAEQAAARAFAQAASKVENLRSLVARLETRKPRADAVRPVASTPARSLAAAPLVGQVRRRFGEALAAPGEQARGITYVARTGAQVSAPSAGEVEYAGQLKGYGNVVILDAGAQVRLVLTGLARIFVEPGDQVRKGEPLGDLAQAPSGQSELYFEVRQNGRPVDPEKWLIGKR